MGLVKLGNGRKTFNQSNLVSSLVRKYNGYATNKGQAERGGNNPRKLREASVECIET